VNPFVKWLKKPVFAEAAAPAAPGAPPPPPAPPAGPPAPAAPAPAAPAAPGAPAPNGATDTLNLGGVTRAVVAAVATAIGVVGLATLVGGAVTWVRLSQIGLPTQTAVSVMPKNDLVALGATGLVIYVGLAILLVAALLAIDPTGRVTGLTVVLLVVLAMVAAIYVLAAAFSWTSRWLLLGALVALLAACVRIGPATGRRFLPFGVAVFFAVLLFGAAKTYRFESDHPKVQPAAVLQSADKTGLIGYFVAATDDRIYLARLERGGRPGALFDFKRDAKTRLAVGRRMDCEFGHGTNVACTEAAIAAEELRMKLLADRRHTKAVAAKGKKKAKKKKR